MVKWITLQQFRTEHEHTLMDLSLFASAQHPNSRQLDVALQMASSASYKIVHPLLIQRWKMPRRRINTNPLSLVGFDVETDATNGLPMLFGFGWDDGHTSHIYQPTLDSFAASLIEIKSNNPRTNLICWGQLDMQAVLRLFDLTETERVRISRGISAKVKKYRIESSPAKRDTTSGELHITHYIPGRSLRLGLVNGGWLNEIWIFNASQFYNARIADSAKTFHIPWVDYPQDTHIIDWVRFDSDSAYRETVYASNQQDALTALRLANLLLKQFNGVFHTYPSVLISTGSLTDAATSALLQEADYNACSQAWIKNNVWMRPVAGKYNEHVILFLETLVAEAYSAGYIDQFGIGYFPTVHTADIASAYPHKIRQLPDLRFSSLKQSQNIDNTIVELANTKQDYFTAYIHGVVHIPPSLRFHPITIRTYMRENYRPTGTFKAAYTLEERQWCIARGATFESEDGVFVLLSERKPSPLTIVSERLGKMRDNLLASRDRVASDSIERSVLEGQQYMVKQVDNSSYGKTVMTIENVEIIEDEPQITGYVTGDRFNQLYGTWITAQTRLQIANACMEIIRHGGQPIMTMTDSIYWSGDPNALPDTLIREGKTPGYFESVHTLREFYIAKTGQYEHCNDQGVWSYKLRGIPIDRNTLHGDVSIYRTAIKEACNLICDHAKSSDIILRIPTKRLVTIGRHDLDMLGAITEGITEIAPFKLTSKNVERDLPWKELLDDHYWLATPHVEYHQDATPLALASQLYLEGFDRDRKHATLGSHVRNRRDDLNKLRFVVLSCVQTGKPPPKGHLDRWNWADLVNYFGVERTE